MTADRQNAPREDSADILSHLTLEDTILWQGPALALAAQAFLLTTALGNDTATFARVISALLAFVTATAAWYLIWRKGRQVKGLEEALGPKLSGSGLSASIVWMAALVIFALADLLIIDIAVTGRPHGWL